MDANKQKADVPPSGSNQADINGHNNVILQDIDNKGGIININNPPEKEKEYHKMAVVFMQAKDFLAAERELTNAINANPNYAPAYADRGMVRLKLEKHRDAIRDYETAVSLDSNLFKALYPLGVLYILDENIYKGCACLKRAMELGHSESEELYNKYCKKLTERKP